MAINLECGHIRYYPVLLTPDEQYVLVHIPDFNISTQGVDIADAMQVFYFVAKKIPSLRG